MDARPIFQKIVFLCKEWVPVLGGIAGLAALYGFVNAFVLLPSRVDGVEKQNIKQNEDIAHIQQDARELFHRVSATEEINKSQSGDLVEIQKDAVQRREMLAVAISRLEEINDRTKRTQEIIMSNAVWKK